MKKLVVSALTNTIYYATVNEKTKRMNPDTRVDVTDNAIACVYEWFMNQMENQDEFSITYRSTPYELVMRKRKDDKKEDES